MSELEHIGAGGSPNNSRRLPVGYGTTTSPSASNDTGFTESVDRSCRDSLGSSGSRRSSIYSVRSSMAPRMTSSFFLPRGSTSSSTFNLVSATLGAGVLALPVAFREAGIALAALSLVICCIGTIYSVYLLLRVASVTDAASFEEIGFELLGRKFALLVEVLMIAFCCGVAVAYVSAIAGVLRSLCHAQYLAHYHPWLKDHNTQKWLTVVFFVLFMLPLSLKKQISSLRYASFFGVCAVGYLIVMMVYHALSSPTFYAHLQHRDLSFFNWDTKGLIALPIILFSFCCQPNVFEIYAEMKVPSINAMTNVAVVGMSCTTSAYLVAAIFAYADFGKHVQDNILENYPPNHLTTTIAIVAICATITFAFPLCIFPSRDSILHMMGYVPRGDFEELEAPDSVRLTLCLCLSTACLICGLAIPSIVTIFGVLGGVCGSCVSFIFPGLFGILVRDRLEHSEVVASWALVILGVFSGVVGTWASLQSR